MDVAQVELASAMHDYAGAPRTFAAMGKQQMGGRRCEAGQAVELSGRKARQGCVWAMAEHDAVQFLLEGDGARSA